jgi:FkbM family methyltransferase
MNIVQIGSNDATDDCFAFIESIDKKLIDNLILIEPQVKYNTKLKEKYKDIKNLYIENIVIIDNEEIDQTNFYMVIDNIGTKDQISSIDKKHTLKHGISEDEITHIKVKCSTINKILKKYNIYELDYLFIDAEGTDSIIIKSIDYKKYNIQNIEYENLHIDNNDLCNFLESKGYKVIQNIGNSGWSNRAIKGK